MTPFLRKTDPVSAHPHQAFGVAVRAMIISAHRERHLALADASNTLIADGRAVRVAAQVLQHLGRAYQRRLGVHHPIVFAEHALPLQINI